MKQNLWCNNNYRYMIQSDGFGKRLSMSQFIFQTSDFTFVRCVQINVENISIDLGSVQVREMQRANRKPGHSTHIPFQPLGNVICLFCKQRLIRLKKKKKTSSDIIHVLEPSMFLYQLDIRAVTTVSETKRKDVYLRLLFNLLNIAGFFPCQ